MKRMSQVIRELNQKWKTPSRAIHRGVTTELRFVCIFSERQIELENFYLKVPNDVKDFWTVSESAVLFKDVDYGQWGLEIFSPEKAMLRSNVEKEQRPTDCYDTDLVIGGFLGDSDLLIISCDVNSRNYGRVFISLPLDGRSDWPVAGENFLDFLEKYATNEGDKYWERSLYL